MGKWLAFLFIMTGLSLAGQEITDDFSDGDFSNNPSWKGDSAFFIINASFQLQLKGNGPGVSSLVIPSPFSKLWNNEWRFWIRENFSPSASNFGRVYLVSDKDSLKDNLNGYYLQFGEAGSNDAVELFRQSGLQSQSVCRGLAGRIASAFSLGVKVTRDSTGFWTVYIDPAGGSNYRREASGLDTLITVGAFFGLMSSYTTSDETKFYWDDFAIRVVLADHSPPQLSALDVISPVSLDLQFDQAMDSITTGTVLNYWVEPDLGNPVIALADSQTQGLIHLHFLQPIQKNRTYTMHVSGLKDKNGIQMQPQLKTFGIFIPGSFDVVINEIMAKPTPAVNLPECEYIELYNRQNFPVNLEGWTLSTGKNSHKLSGIQIQPDSFVVLCSASSAIQFGTDLPVYGVVGFPALSNTGEELSLENDSGRIISEVNYSDTWFRNPDKRGGGWSLEQIDPSNPCGGVSNWIDSQNSNGGTPGKRNSVFTANADHSPPELVRAYVLSVDSVCLVFNEPLDTSSVLLPADYQMDNGINVQSVFPVKKEYRNVVLCLNTPLQKGIRYTITIQSRISDCVGNQILPGNSARLAIPDSACYRDVIINEILSDP
ncbi:MAG TPA: lamin tail domain-containing protein, partial [Bacteroidia bacterium]|nr:lamin tail domain-containing protein [Bacteroidia bacterium]